MSGFKRMWRIKRMNQNIINQMKRYQHKKEIVKAVKYQEGMEDGWIILLLNMSL